MMSYYATSRRRQEGPCKCIEILPHVLCLTYEKSGLEEDERMPCGCFDFLKDWILH